MTTVTIEIDNEVFEVLGKIAKPFEETTPNLVIRRLLRERGDLGSSSQAGGTSSKTKRGVLVPQWVYEKWLLWVLGNELGGRAEKPEAVEATVAKMEEHGLLTGADYETVSTGEKKCENTTAWGRSVLAKRGWINTDAPRGVWELTEQGRKEARKVNPPKDRTWDKAVT